MLTYIARRLLLTIPTVFIVTVIVFVMIRLVPGDAVDAMALRLSQQGMEIDLVREEIEAMLGLDVPVLTQYGRWIGILPNKDGVIDGLLQGNLGGSYWRAYTVNQEIARRLPSTLELGILALIVSQIIALPIGIYSALRQDTIGDYIGRSIAIIFIAVPSFWIATMVIIFPALWWGYMPPVMKKPFFEDPLRHLRAYIVPATVLGMSMSGLTMRMARTMMLEVLRQDYIRTAWAKGLRERVVIVGHALKNALIPVVTAVGLQLPLLIGGTVIIETIFVLPGMGSLIVDSTTTRDYPMLSGAMLFFAFGLIIINILVDLTYAYLDPRIQYE